MDYWQCEARGKFSRVCVKSTDKSVVTMKAEIYYDEQLVVEIIV